MAAKGKGKRENRYADDLDRKPVGTITENPRTTPAMERKAATPPGKDLPLKQTKKTRRR